MEQPKSTIKRHMSDIHVGGLPLWLYLLALVLGGALTLTLYALVRRVPVLRYLVLGISGKGSHRA